jgi:hypothetical protein
MKIQHTYYAEYSIKSWLSFLLNGEIKRPPYQRQFVWGIQKAANLVRTVLDGNFVPPVVIAATQHNFGAEKDGIYEIPAGIYLVDGQQRLTSLLLFYLGVWPAADTGKTTTPDIDDENEETDSIDTPIDDIVKVFSTLSSIDKLAPKLLKSNKYVRLGDVSPTKNLTTADLKEITELANRISQDSSGSFLSSYLGYSYVRSTGDQNTEKRLFANLFRDINTTGQKLLPAESRRAMYFLEPTLKGLFEPNFLTSYKIGANDVDFPKYLSYVDELYLKYSSSEWGNEKQIPATSYIARGYSNNAEDYILAYLVRMIDTDLERGKEYLKNIDIFTEYVNAVFPDTKVKDIPSFEIRIFGLIFWTLFAGRKIDISRLEEVKSKFADYKYDANKRIGGIRERLTKSIEAYKGVLSNA